MNIKIEPVKLTGTIPAITSKSDAHRCLICASLSKKTTEMVLCDYSRDILATMNCLENMGTEFKKQENNILEVIPHAFTRETHLNCGESGSTLRFLLPVTTVVNRTSHLSGEGRLPERPLSPLKEEMEKHGVTFSQSKLPLTLTGALTPGEYRLPGNISSQYVTGLLLALPLLEGSSDIILTSPLESAGYVKMTLRTLSKFGVNVENTDYGFHIPGKQSFQAEETIVVENDWSNGAFWLAAGAIGNELTVKNLPADAIQSDKAIIEYLKEFGAEINKKENEITVSPALMNGITIDVSGCPDLVPILSVLASAAKGKTSIINAARLRIKESDRLTSVAAMINNLGGNCIELEDSLEINGCGTLKGGKVDSFNDHRIAMAAAVASIICKEPVEILNADAVNKSYPDFFKDFKDLGGCYHVL